MSGHILKLVIHGQAVEEGMFERLREREPGAGIVLEHPSDQVQHDPLLLTLEGGGAAAAVLRQGPAVLGRVPGRRHLPVPRQPTVVEKVCLGPPDYVGRELPEDPRHHGQVLQVVVGLEQRVALQQRGVLVGVEESISSLGEKSLTLYIS